jgi:protease II
MEYEEFGDPLHHPTHFKALAKITPVMTIPSGLEEVPLVLARTGLHDKQVAAYEVLKWAIQLRRAGWTAAVGVDTHGGHFPAANAAAKQYAEDAALLDSWIGYTPPRHHSTIRHPRTTSSR